MDTTFPCSIPISILQLGVSAHTTINLTPSFLLQHTEAIAKAIVSLFTTCRLKLIWAFGLRNWDVLYLYSFSKILTNIGSLPILSIGYIEFFLSIYFYLFTFFKYIYMKKFHLQQWFPNFLVIPYFEQSGVFKPHLPPSEEILTKYFLNLWN